MARRQLDTHVRSQERAWKFKFGSCQYLQIKDLDWRRSAGAGWWAGLERGLRPELWAQKELEIGQKGRTSKKDYEGTTLGLLSGSVS